mgnify:FL=1
MTIEDLKTIDELEAFLEGSQPIAFSVLGNKNERYNFIRKELVKFRYLMLTKKRKGVSFIIC